MNNYIFKIIFLDDPKISREIEVPSNWNLYRLAGAILKAFKFRFDHCFGFYSNTTGVDYFQSKESYELFADLEDMDDVEPVTSKSVEKTKIKDVWIFPQDKMLFFV